VAQDYKIVPAGTKVVVGILEQVDSNVQKAGTTFAARLEAPLVAVDDETTVVEPGAPVDVQLVSFDPSPGVADNKAYYALSLKSVTIDGEEYPVTSGFGEVVTPAKEIAAGGVSLQGAAEPEDVVAAVTAGEPAEAVVVPRGAGLAMHVVEGPVLDIGADLDLQFTLAQLLTVGPEEEQVASGSM
jgi:hypothetical protein